MVDELEGTQEIIPENAELFRQGAEPDEPVAAPPAPEPTPEPVAAEPELPPVEPSWLNEPVEQPEAPPQQPQYQYQQPPPQPQYPQQPQVPHGTGTDAALQTFVDNPEAWAAAQIEQRLSARDAQTAQQNQAIQNMTGMLMQDRVTEATSGVDSVVEMAYNVFNRDTAFRSDKDMQQSLRATLQGMKQQAEYQARTTGDFSALRQMAGLSETDMEASLAYMKVKAGKQSPGTGPLQVDGATVESSRSAVASQSVELTPEEYEIARRLGPGQEAKIKQAKLDQIKYDDLEYKG